MPSNRDNELQALIAALTVAEQAGDSIEQIRLYTRLTTLLPAHAVAHARTAALLQQQGEHDEALQHIHLALAQPQDDEVDAIVFPLMGQRDNLLTQDIALAHQWFQDSPNEWRLVFLIQSLVRQEMFDDAEQLTSKALEHQEYAGHTQWLLLMLAHVFQCQLRFHESIACCQIVLDSSPDNRDALHILAIDYSRIGQYRKAIEHYSRILSNHPEDIDTHHCLSHLMLKLGDFEHGWQHWEWRWAKSIANQTQSFNIPEWQGEPINNSRVLVWGEQGIGDQIMFSSLANDLAGHAGEIFWECDARLEPLFRRSLERINFIAQQQATQGKPLLKLWPSSDVHIPAGSLGKFLRNKSSDFVGKSPFLIADAKCTTQFRQNYQQRFPNKRLIGISWKGGANASTNKYARTIALTSLLPLAQLKDIQLINLQYGKVQQELGDSAQLGLHIFNDETVDPLQDLDRQAAQIAALDAVLSIDNTTVHLSGALGVKTYLLLPTDPDWRWGIEGDSSYWYPSVELIRNPSPDSWAPAVSMTMERLKAAP